MLTRLSTPSPFPQTPARQTAPAAQLPAAQRQGFSGARFKLGREILSGLQNLPLVSLDNFAEQKSLHATLKAEIDDFTTIAKMLEQLSSEGDYSRNRGAVEARLSKLNPGLLGVFQTFHAECPAEARSSIINAKISQAVALRKAFEELRDRHFPGSL